VYRKSELTVIVSDIHFPHHVVNAWAAFREFHRETRPKTTIIGGDFLDLAQLSSFTQDPRESVYVIPEIQMFVREANALAAECEELVIIEGNHEARWSRFIEPVAIKLRGALGLTLKEQCEAQGLTKRAKWRKESAVDRGIKIQQFTFRHGDKDFGRYGGGKNPASTLIDKTYGGESPITGHLHQCQLITRRRADGTLITSIQNGTFEKPADYDPKFPWIHSFTILEKCSDTWATPHPVIIEGGIFAYGGRVYDGNERVGEVPITRPSIPSDVMLPSRPPVPFYMPHEYAAPPSTLDDKAAELLHRLDELRAETREAVDSIGQFGEPVEADRPLSPVAALPPPPTPPRKEIPTRDDHCGTRNRVIEHPVTKEAATIASWARRLGVPRSTLVSRLDRVDRAIVTGANDYTLADALSPAA